jgi:hypothetical protein
MSDQQSTPPPSQPQPSEPQPVPPPQPKQPSSGPVPVPPPTPKPPQPPADDDDAPLSLVESADPEQIGRKAKAFGSAAATQPHHMGKEEFHRPMNITGQGATRCRLFYSKISDGPLLHMETVINEWLDNEEIEVKHVGHVVGTLEGKRSEQNVIVMVWY